MMTMTPTRIAIFKENKIENIIIRLYLKSKKTSVKLMLVLVYYDQLCMIT